jgi:hypothetical protein
MVQEHLKVEIKSKQILLIIQKMEMFMGNHNLLNFSLLMDTKKKKLHLFSNKRYCGVGKIYIKIIFL